MSLSIKSVVARLEHDPSKLPQIRSFDSLIAALKELDSIIGMKSAKESICLQLEYIIMRLAEQPQSGSIFDDHFLHTVISGPPGVGKTQLGKILAKIWFSLGIIKGRSQVPPIPPEYVTKINSTNQRLDLAIQFLNEPLVFDPTIQGLIEDHRNFLISIRQQNELPANPTVVSQEVPFKIATRADFVAKYVGQTAPKTQKVLEDAVGGVLFIDEAYSLMNRSDDSFGMEALTVINQFMSEHPDELIIIFAGYKDLLDETIFRAQPGLKRRCSWTFDISGYSPIDLAQIFQRQLDQYGWKVDPEVDLVQFFTQHQDKFPNYGGDTHRLAFHCKLYHHHHQFNKLTQIQTDEVPNSDYEKGTSRKRKRVDQSSLSSKKPKVSETNRLISELTLQVAFEKYCANLNKSSATNEPPFGMYM